MANENNSFPPAESEAKDQPLADDTLDQVSGGGDFNRDGDVDGSDFLQWQRNSGANSSGAEGPAGLTGESTGGDAASPDGVRK